jgi:hypothetical protein
MSDFHNTSLNQYEAQQAADHRYLMGLDSETCWQDPGFRDFASDVENALMDLPHVAVSIDEDWVVEEMLTVFKQEGDASEAVSAIEDGYDPTPQTAYDDFH